MTQISETLPALASSRWPSAWLAPCVFAALTIGMFHDVLLSGQCVVSSQTTDLALQFIPWREFGFSQLRAGNLALWNPHIFGGAPYFAGFQAALLYPPNWLHLILPLGLAINWIVAAHVFAAGYFAYLWCRGRRISMGGSLLAGVMFMFCGPYFLHLYAGHLPHLAVMVWAPLILLAIDKLATTGRPQWTLLGASAIAMQILAGHPQYVYYTAMALAIYTAMQLGLSSRRWRLVGGFVGSYVGGAMIAAVQLLSGIDMAGETVRAGGTAFEFASTFALPPLNLVTLIAPTFFGSLPLEPTDTTPLQYWGAGYLWEMSLFAGTTGLVLAVVGLAGCARRATVPILVMIAATLVLALGRHTPLYRPMFDLLPGYGSFRGTVKFAYLTMLLVSLLAAMGFDELLKRRRASWALIGSTAASAVVISAIGWCIERSSAWKDFVNWVVHDAAKAQEMFAKARADDTTFLASSAAHAAHAMYIAAGTIAGAVALIALSRLHRWIPFGLIVLCGVEMFVFARSTRATMDPQSAQYLPDIWNDALAALQPHQRVLVADPAFQNVGMLLGFEGLWGYDPGVLKRYAQVMAASQHLSPDQASQYLRFYRVDYPIFRMLRCRMVFTGNPNLPVVRINEPLAVAQLITAWEVKSSPEKMLASLTDRSFDPRQVVLLEEPPGIDIRRTPAPPGLVRVLSTASDEIELQADVVAPAILLITNNYSRGWRIVALADGPQRDYRLIPANHTQQAIPLHTGRHHLRIEYLPTAFRVGRWISVVSVLCWAAAAFWLMRTRHMFR